MFRGWCEKVDSECLIGSSSSCLGRSCFLIVMPTVARLLLFFQLLQAFGFVVPEAAVSKLPVILAVLVDQAHLRLAQDGQQVFVLASTRSPGTGLQRSEGGAAGLHQHVVHCAAGKDHELQFDQRVFEVLLRGRALVDAAVRGLQGADQKTLFCFQDASL